MSLLTVRQAGVRLRVGYSTLKHWIYDGRVRTRVTTGGHHRIAEAEVDRLLAPGSPPPTRPAARGRVGHIVALSGRNQLRGFVEEVRGGGTETAPRRRRPRHRQVHRSDDRARGRRGGAHRCTAAAETPHVMAEMAS